MKNLDKYSQYISGALPEAEIEAFTRQIVTAHFEKEKLQEKWQNLLQRDHDLASLKKKPGVKQLKSKWRKFFLPGLSVAASVLLLVLAWFAYQPLSVPTYEKLLSEELNSPFIETLIRKGSVEEMRLIAVEHYNSREYAEAAIVFEEIAQIDKEEDWDFYIGLCQLYQRNSDLAIQSFNSVMQHTNTKYTIEANWYLGLAYIMKGDFTLAKKYLEKVATDSRDEQAWKVKEARALLKALEEK